MCLVFCAFASWAVKTSDLQAPDAWKTSTYSARLHGAGEGRQERSHSPELPFPLGIRAPLS
uniref:Uncharacterized protein n=1 Tax=Catharus ustulatus TaxID=91951 RepID=A0A8C3UDZ9_CATUS